MAMYLPPPPSFGEVNTPEWKKWFFQLQQFISELLPVPFKDLDFTDSDITSLENRKHNDLQDLEGGDNGEYFHLSEDEHDELISQADIALHFHASDRDLTNATGNLPIQRLNGGVGANGNTYWAGDGTWKPAGGGSGKIYESLVSLGFNQNVAYAEADEYVPNFLTSSAGDIIVGWSGENAS